MGRDEVNKVVVDQGSLVRPQISFSSRLLAEEKAHIKNIHPRLVDKEALKQRLDENQPLSQGQNQRAEPCTSALPNS